MMFERALAGGFACALVFAPSVQAEVSEATLQSISIPDKVETSIGTLEFFDGVPKDATIQAVYENLDRMRAVDVYLDNMGGVSINSVMDGLAAVGADAQNRLAVAKELLDSQSLVLTANTSTLYAWGGTDLQHAGPTVIEIPPGMLGFLDDSWQRFVGNMGITGPDKGKGGKYLLLPPGYDGAVPEGYFVMRPPTYRNFLFLRASIKNGLEAAVESITSGVKIYALKDAGDPPATEYADISGKSFNTVFPNDLQYFEILNEMVQREPIAAIGPDVRGKIAALGIVKGQPFKPDERMQKILVEAAAIGSATARAITYHPRMEGVYIYPDSSWTVAYANKNTSFQSDGAMHPDARVLFYFNAGGVTPAMAVTRAGAGSDYALAYLDADKKPFDGSKAYRIQLPPNVPVNDFWALTLYDTQTRSQLQTSQRFPTVGSQTKGLQQNADGSYDIYFSPKAPAGKESNWLQTIPGKSWFTILRMYGPLEPWIDKSWRPGEIELVE
ncbi:MAG: DUF1254 domain-containing protein [Pseudomonadota bacterium]